jgi:hypothetical protein
MILSLFFSFQSYILFMWMSIFPLYLLRVKKNNNKEEKKEMRAGVLSLTDSFINRRLHIYKTCWIIRNLSFALYSLSKNSTRKDIITVLRVCFHMIIWNKLLFETLTLFSERKTEQKNIHLASFKPSFDELYNSCHAISLLSIYYTSH